MNLFKYFIRNKREDPDPKPLCSHPSGRIDFQCIEHVDWDEQSQQYKFRIVKVKYWRCDECGDRELK